MIETTYRPIRSANPTFEPITVGEAKKQIELPASYTQHDAYVEDLIKSAREILEIDSGLVLATGTFTLKYDEWPCGDRLELPLRPVSTITSIQYVDNASATQTFSSGDYSLVTHTVFPSVLLGYGKTWPSSFRGHPGDITVTLVAGYANRDAVPMAAKHACMLLVRRMFDDRDGMERVEQDLAAYVRSYEMLVRRLQRSSYP